MAASLSFKRSDTIADSIPEALRQSQYQMKRCFSSYVSKGKRLMKNKQLMAELEKSMDDKVEKAKLMEDYTHPEITGKKIDSIISLVP